MVKSAQASLRQLSVGSWSDVRAIEAAVAEVRAREIHHGWSAKLARLRRHMKPAYYQAPLAAFLRADPSAILGELAKSHGFALENQQRDAWLYQISVMKRALARLGEGYILFEFSVPRLGKRSDVVLLIRGLIVVIEFKVGATIFERRAIEQVHDYALTFWILHSESVSRHSRH
jgi:hypothetical protein